MHTRYITLSANRAQKQLAPPSAVTNAVSWRPPGIVHRKNEIFLDVVESLDLLVSSNGSVLHSEILGAVKMRSYLSGMPELKLGLNDKVRCRGWKWARLLVLARRRCVCQSLLVDNTATQKRRLTNCVELLSLLFVCFNQTCFLVDGR